MTHSKCGFHESWDMVRILPSQQSTTDILLLFKRIVPFKYDYFNCKHTHTAAVCFLKRQTKSEHEDG